MFDAKVHADGHPATQTFTVPTPTPGDKGEVEYNLAPEAGTAPTDDTEG